MYKKLFHRIIIFHLSLKFDWNIHTYKYITLMEFERIISFCNFYLIILIIIVKNVYGFFHLIIFICFMTSYNDNENESKTQIHKIFSYYWTIKLFFIHFSYYHFLNYLSNMRELRGNQWIINTPSFILPILNIYTNWISFQFTLFLSQYLHDIYLYVKKGKILFRTIESLHSQKLKKNVIFHIKNCTKF